MQYASYTSLVPHSLLAAIWKSGMEKRPERRKGRYDDAFIQKKKGKKSNSERGCTCKKMEIRIPDNALEHRKNVTSI